MEIKLYNSKFKRQLHWISNTIIDMPSNLTRLLHPTLSCLFVGAAARLLNLQLELLTESLVPRTQFIRALFPSTFPQTTHLKDN